MVGSWRDMAACSHSDQHPPPEIRHEITGENMPLMSFLNALDTKQMSSTQDFLISEVIKGTCS